MNHIIGMGLQRPVTTAEVDRVEEFYRSRNSICEVVVSPYADMSLVQELGKRGYRVTEWNSFDAEARGRRGQPLRRERALPERRSNTGR